MARHAETPEEVAPGLRRSTSIVLAVAPYGQCYSSFALTVASPPRFPVWALPILLVPAAALARNGWKQPTVAFEGSICVLHYQTLFFLAGFMLWIPLASSLLLSVAVSFYVWRFYHRHHGIISSRQMPDFSPMLRFGAMTAIIVTTTVFFALINASGRPKPALIRTGRFWQGVYMVMFPWLILIHSSISHLDPAPVLHLHTSAGRPCLDRLGPRPARSQNGP